MVFPLYDLHDLEFEDLAIKICQKILGNATIPFSKGKDGGKDGRFIGRANCFPSETKPWEGKIIIQAKHTTKVNACCSDIDFIKILENEIHKIQNLKNNNELDFYLLFSNRKLTGIQDSKFSTQMREFNITYEIVANEKIQHFLQIYPDIARSLNHLLKPLEFDYSDLKEIIIALNETIKKNEIVINNTDFSQISLDEKNKLNNLSKSYFDNVIKRNFEYFNKIDSFLALPINSYLKDLYDDSVSEINAKTVLHREKYLEFENIIEDLYDYMISSIQEDLKEKKRLIRTMLNYMYCLCDIGKKD